MGAEIPIQNIYYLLCYAWNRLEQGSLIDISQLPSTELVDLFAVVLVKGVEHLARRGLESGYNPQEEDIRGIRGRIDILRSKRRFLPQHGRAACCFDELTPNTLGNQIIKATLRALASDADICSENRRAVLRLARSLNHIDDINVTTHSFHRVQLHSNNRFYRFLLNVCELVFRSKLPDETIGTHRFRDFLRDEKKMALLFQHFVRNFLRIERPDLQVSAESIDWCATSASDPELLLLPQMITDVSVITANGKVVIETKYYRETLNQHFDSFRLHSGNLYQLFSYLVNLRAKGEFAEGILLYPQVDRQLNEQYLIGDHLIRVKTLNLSQEWGAIHKDLKNLIN